MLAQEKNPCLEVAENNNIVLKDNHYYYNKVQIRWVYRVNLDVICVVY